MNQILTCIDFQKISEVLKRLLPISLFRFPSHDSSNRKSGGGGICSSQILTLDNIVIRVPPHQKRLKQITNSTYRLAHCKSKEKASESFPSPYSTQGPSLWVPSTQGPSPTPTVFLRDLKRINYSFGMSFWSYIACLAFRVASEGFCGRGRRIVFLCWI